jgi:hypothetical protein
VRLIEQHGTHGQKFSQGPITTPLVGDDSQGLRKPSFSIPFLQDVLGDQLFVRMPTLVADHQATTTATATRGERRY